jgi:hypothetical protein
MGNCCASQRSQDAAVAAEALRDEIANPSVDKAPSFNWRFRDGYGNVRLKHGAAAEIAEGIRRRAADRAGPIALELMNMDLGDRGATHLAASLAEGGTRVSSLVLTGNGLTSEGVRCIADSITSACRLERLMLGRNDVDEEGLAALATMIRRLHTLRVLDVPLGSAEHTVGVGAVSGFADAIRASHLQALSAKVWGRGASGDSVAAVLGAAVECPSAQEFRITTGPEAAAVPSEALSLSSSVLQTAPCRLTVLEFRNLRLDGDAFDALFAGLSSDAATLNELVLFACGLSMSAAKGLASALSTNRSLTTLDISANPELQEKGLGAVFASLRSNRTLTTLNVTQVPLPVAVARVLVETLELPTAAPLTIARHSMIDDDRLATRLADVLQRNEGRIAAAQNHSLSDAANAEADEETGEELPDDAMYSPAEGRRDGPRHDDEEGEEAEEEEEESSPAHPEPCPALINDAQAVLAVERDKSGSDPSDEGEPFELVV